MKQLLLMLVLYVSPSYAQLDIGTQLSASGGFYASATAFTLVPDTYIVVGATYGYEYLSPNVNQRAGILVGWQADEWMQIEFDLYAVQWTDTYSMRWSSPNPDYMKTKWSPMASLGCKALVGDHAFVSLKVSWPGFAELGLGFRLRPWNKLEPHRTYKRR